MTTGHQTNRCIFLLAGGIHLFWGVGLLFWDIGRVTAIANVVGGMQALPAAILMIVVGVASISSTCVKNHLAAFGLLVAQQIVLVLSALAAVQCASAGQYPDGTIAPSAHILHDQAIFTIRHHRRKPLEGLPLEDE